MIAGRPVAMSAWMATPQALGLLPESPVYITWAEDTSAPGRASDGRSHLQSPPAPTLNPAPSGLGKRAGARGKVLGDWGHIQTNRVSGAHFLLSWGRALAALDPGLG